MTDVDCEQPLPALAVNDTWTRVFDPTTRQALVAHLLHHLRERRWFRGKSRVIIAAQIVDAVPLDATSEGDVLVLLRVRYSHSLEELYALPLAFATTAQLTTLTHSVAIVGPLTVALGTLEARAGVLYDATTRPSFARQMLHNLALATTLKGNGGALHCHAYSALPRELSGATSPTVVTGEQTNTTVLFPPHLVLKLLRRVEIGTNVEVELGKYLGYERRFQYAPALAGDIVYEADDGSTMTVALAHRFVDNDGDAWQFTLAALDRYRLRQASRPALNNGPQREHRLVALIEHAPSNAQEVLGEYAASASRIGERTAQLHLTLASDTRNADFVPEPLTQADLTDLQKTLREQRRDVLQRLAQALPRLPSQTHGLAEGLLAADQNLDQVLRRLNLPHISGQRIRCHGDYHLGQLLVVGDDFAIVDFEGEPNRPLCTRRGKHSPLTDVAGMLRSFHYAAISALRASPTASELSTRLAAAELWCACASGVFLQAYFAGVAGTPLLPTSVPTIVAVLEALLLEKVFYEVSYELNHRPDWVEIPLLGLLSLLR